MYTRSLESETRIEIDKRLENLGYNFFNKSDKFKNVYTEQPRTEYEKEKLNGKRPDYVIYSKDNDKPIMIIEAKRKGENVNKALEQGKDYARILGAPMVFATDGVFTKTHHITFDKTPILNGEEVDEFIRETLALKYLDNWNINTVSDKVLYDRQTLIKIFSDANNILRAEGLRAGIERFGEFSNILFLKLISEAEDYKREMGQSSDFDRICHWDEIKRQNSNSRIEYINKMVFGKLNDLYGTDIFSPLQIKTPDILNEIMYNIDPLKLNDVDSDVKGDAFEYFLRASTASGNDLGEYFTPRNIVKTMVKLVNPQFGEKIYDPFCGTGGFLIESFRHIWNNMPRNSKNNKYLREETIYGNEITNTARITKMNMILAGDGHSNINMKDSLANPVNGKYDIVLANMPYSQRTKYGNLYDLPSTNGDSVCVQHCIKAINSTAENGRMAIVVPEGFLFRKDLKKVREYMLETCNLKSIISLPQGVFLPYTSVKTDIIYCEKINNPDRNRNKSKSFWYFDVKNDGYTLDNHRRKIDGDNDLDKYQEYRKFDNDQNKEMLDIGFKSIEFKKVMENNHILLGNRYGLNLKLTNGITKKLSDLIEETRDKANDEDVKVLSVTNETGFISSEDNFRYRVASKDISKYKIVRKNEFAYNPSRINVGSIAINQTDTIGCVSPMYVTFKVKENADIIPEFLFILLKSDTVNKVINNLTTGSVRQVVKFDDFSSIEIPILSLHEQEKVVKEIESYQKIINGAKQMVDNYKPNMPLKISGEQLTLKNIATFKPTKDLAKTLAEDTLVSFVPMCDININSLYFEAKQEREIGDVLKGYTYFENDDILLAKITPCFENGKAGIAKNLKNGIGFGSTEYIVIRANTKKVYPEWIYYHINSEDFLSRGENYMTGTAGQKRIDIDYVKDYLINVPSLEEQRKILDDIHSEISLIEHSKQIVEVFTKKIHDKIESLFV